MGESETRESHGVFMRIPRSMTVSGGSKRKEHCQPHELEARPSMWTDRSWPLEARLIVEVWRAGCVGGILGKAGTGKIGRYHVLK